MIYTATTGNNAAMIASVAELYVKDGQRVADVTYGRGEFWQGVETQRFELLASDLITTPTKQDFRRLKYEDGSLDHLVLDPPYMHNAGRPMVEARYKNAETTKGMYHADIMRLYGQGILEAWRVLRVGGMLWVKCQDEIESGIQRWSHIEIYDTAMWVGLGARDLFILVRQGKPTIQHKRQLHARKNHSYLWIFEKPDHPKRKALLRARL